MGDGAQGKREVPYVVNNTNSTCFTSWCSSWGEKVCSVAGVVTFLPRVDAQTVILVWRTSIPYPLQRLALLLTGQVSKQLPSCIAVLGPKRQLLYGVSSVMGRAWMGLHRLEQEEG